MKIVWITPAPFMRRIKPYRWGGKTYGKSNSITGPLILGGILKRAGHEVSIYEELNGDVPYKKLIPVTDVFCFSIMTSNAPRAYELCDRIRAENPKARLIIGGIHATAMPNEALGHADQVMIGEGENTILDVIEGRRTEKIVRCVPCENLDDVPFPDYSILKTPCKAANIITSRGCPFCCTFCTTSRMFAPYRERSVENVLQEIRTDKKMGFKYMNFEDDNFTADKERAKKILRGIIAEHLQFDETFFFGRTDLAKDEELLDLLKEAHLTRVLMGIESLNQKALDSIHKGQSVQDIKNAAQACKKHGIRVIASIVLGIDDDNLSDIQRSVQFAKDIDAYQLQPAILTPYPGTPVYRDFLDQGRIHEHDWTRYDMMSVTFQPMHMTAWQLQEAFYKASDSFYTFRSALRIGHLFGRYYGRQRMRMWRTMHLGTWAARVLSRTMPKSPFFQLRHAQWANVPFQARQPIREAKSVAK
jgi:radical SAM superfamily enzyme YgiQ (UPF0313 family)